MTRFYTHKVANLTLAVSKRLTWHSCRFFALVANQCLCFTVTPCQARPSVFCKRMSTAKFKHGHIIKLWWAEWKLILKEWLKESLILHILKITKTDDVYRWLHPLEYSVQEKQNPFMADRGQPDLNRWPLDLQSNALPLSYAPRLKDCHEPTNPDSKLMANVPKMDWLIYSPWPCLLKLQIIQGCVVICY